jgi:hypothetical protein
MKTFLTFILMMVSIVVSAQKNKVEKLPLVKENIVELSVRDITDYTPIYTFVYDKYFPGGRSLSFPEMTGSYYLWDDTAKKYQENMQITYGLVYFQDKVYNIIACEKTNFVTKSRIYYLTTDANFANQKKNRIKPELVMVINVFDKGTRFEVYIDDEPGLVLTKGPALKAILIARK